MLPSLSNTPSLSLLQKFFSLRHTHTAQTFPPSLSISCPIIFISIWFLYCSGEDDRIRGEERAFQNSSVFISHFILLLLCCCCCLCVAAQNSLRRRRRQRQQRRQQRRWPFVRNVEMANPFLHKRIKIPPNRKLSKNFFQEIHPLPVKNFLQNERRVVVCSFK